MTIKEFNTIKFASGMHIIYKGERYEIIAVDFEESLIAIDEKNDPENLSWKWCEHCELLG
jgi:hypothetical protein